MTRLNINGGAAAMRDTDPHVSQDEHWPDAECRLRGTEHDYDGDPNLIIPPGANDFWEKLKTEPGFGYWEHQPDPETQTMLMLDVVSGLATSICDECKRRILTDIFYTLLTDNAVHVVEDALPKPTLVN